jgi:hypothetical protein
MVDRRESLLPQGTRRTAVVSVNQLKSIKIEYGLPDQAFIYFSFHLLKPSALLQFELV